MRAIQQRKLREIAILDAAEHLIRSHGGTDFSMLKLAKKADLSPATPYNIFGTKASILYALLNRSMDNILSNFQAYSNSMGPCERVLTAGSAAAQFFIADPSYYRPLYQYLIGVRDPVHRPIYMDMAFAYWRQALSLMRERGQLRDDNERDIMALSIMTYFLGGLDLWVQGEFSDSQFHANIIYGVASLLFKASEDEARPFLMNSISTAQASMPQSFHFSQNYIAGIISTSCDVFATDHGLGACPGNG